MKLLENRFTSYTLDIDEELRGQCLSAEQRWVLQNRLAEIAIGAISFKFDPNDQIAFAQQEAYAKGQMDLLESIFAEAEYAERELTKRNTDTNIPEE